MPAEYISLIIAALGFAASVYFSGKKAKNEDIDKVAKEVRRDTEVNMKLDSIMASTADTAKKLDRLQEDMAEMKTQYSAAFERLGEVEKRVDRLEVNLGKLHQEHREHMAMIREGKEKGGA